MGQYGFGSMVFTQQGLQLLAKAQAGTPLQFTRIAVGDGVVSGQDVTTFTDIIHEILSLGIDSIVSVETQATVCATLSNASLAAGFYWREIGLFAQDPQLGEILFGYDNATGHEIYVPPASQSSFTAPLDVAVYVSGVASVTATINPYLPPHATSHASGGSDPISPASIGAAGAAAFSTHQSAATLDHPDGSVTDAKIGTRTPDQSQAAAAGPGTLSQILSWIVNRLKAIIGSANWYDAPATTLAAAGTHAATTGTGVHGSAIAATVNTLAHRDASGDLTARVLKASAADGTAPIAVTSTTVITNLNADAVDGLHAADFAPASHPGLTGAGTHGSATAATANTLAHRDANGDLTARRILSSIANGTAPLGILSQTLVANLNADMLDGKHLTDLFQGSIAVGAGTGSAKGVTVTLGWQPDFVIAYHKGSGSSASAFVDFRARLTNLNLHVDSSGANNVTTSGDSYINIVSNGFTLYTAGSYTVESYGWIAVKAS